MRNNQHLLVSRIIRNYLVIGVTSYIILFFYWLDSMNYYNVLNVWALLSYAYLLWMCINKDEEYFTSRRLWLTVFLYTLLFTALYLQMSYFYTGNTFLFSESDASAYEHHAFHMKDRGFTKAITYISHIWGYDDWGAPMSMAFLLKIIPNKLFVNFCYVVLNSLSALCIFSMGTSLKMSRKYAYLAALSYAIASYTIFFLGSFLKEEMMCFLVIASFYMLYQYQRRQKMLYLAIGGMTSLLIVFFRVPIALFIWLSYASILLLGDKGHIKRMLFMFVFVFIAIIAAGLVMYSSNLYANNGDVTHSYQYVTTTLFQKTVSSVGALVGPFPALFQISTVPFTAKPLFGAGLLFKFLLFFPFWKGFILCMKTRAVEMYPLFLFAIMEMVGLCLVFDGLELRKAMPHVALFILCAFWYMDKFDKDTTEEIRATPYYYWTYKGLSASMMVVFLVTLTWNVLLRIPGVQHIILFSTDQ